LLVWVLAAAGLVVTGAAALKSGRHDAEAVRTRGLRPLIEGATFDDLGRAAARFRTAESRFSSPLLLPARVLPVAGRQLRSAAAVARASRAVADEGIAGVRRGRHVLATSAGPGPQRVAQLRSFAALARRSDRAMARISLGPSQALVAPLAGARRDVAATIGDVRAGLVHGAAAADAIAELLAGPRNYLVFAANTSEMRAGSGMFLSVGRMQTAGGKVDVTDMASVNNVAVPGGVPLAGDLADRWGWLAPQTDWRNLMLSPRFDESAALAARMWQAAGKGPVDGVIALDPLTLRAVLRATGPVDAGGRHIDATNVVEELTHAQYTRFPNLDEKDERREELSAIAGAVVQALSERAWSPEVLAEELALVARGRHVLAWSNRKVEQAGWTAAGLDGRLRADSLMVAILNRGGNKLDYWLPVEVTLELRPVGGHTEGVVSVHMRNTTRPDEPEYVAGPHYGLPLAPGEYLGLASLTLPGAASGGRLDGFGDLAVVGPDGPTRVIAAEFQLPRGEQRTIVARFAVPGRHGALRVESSAREPSVPWRFRDERWRDDRAYVVRW
jgi:hypothetical protein